MNPWIELPTPLVYLAPMSGVTNQAYRAIVKSFATDIVFPEFVSADAIHYDSKKTLEILNYDETERPIIAQLFGAQSEHFKTATKKIIKLGFDGVDINFGCSVPKVSKTGAGCALLGNLKKAKHIIETVIEATEGKIPVSVKTRKSYKNTTVQDFCDTISDLPLSAICIHGRTFEKPYVGAADLDCIKQAKDLVPFKVIASGHGHTPEAAKETLDYTQADGITIARGTFGKPWIIKQIKEYLATGSYSEPTKKEVLDTMLKHAELAYQAESDRPFIEIRKVLSWYIKGIPNAAKYRAALVRVKDIAEVKKIIEEVKTSI